jgi:hypothetical protein
VLHNTVYASLEPRFVSRLDESITVWSGTSGVDGILLVHVTGVTKFLAKKTFVREVPTVK